MISIRVVNASPLILLAKAGHLELLRVGGLEVRVPEAVIAEIEAQGIDDPTAIAVRSTAWLQVVSTPIIPDRVGSWSLGAGESGVLAVALEIPDCEVILFRERSAEVGRRVISDISPEGRAGYRSPEALARQRVASALSPRASALSRSCRAS